MANREQRLERAVRSMEQDIREAARELRAARRRSGLTQQAVASALGVSHATIKRNEDGRHGVRLLLVAQHAAATGMRARLKLYPGDDPIRDGGQVNLIRRLRSHLGQVGSWTFEVPLPHPYDQRALDAVLTLPAGRIGLEFYTRLADAQAQLRAAHVKKRDAELDRLIVVVQATHANRRALRAAGDALVDLFPGSSRRLLQSLRAGELPSADGVILF